MQGVEAKKEFSIGELSNAAHVTARTIRYYVAEGLLAPPEKGGRGATYNEEHLARLQLIKRLKEEYLPLQEIASLLRGLDRQAVVELLKQKQQAIAGPRSSAKAYLKDLLEASGGGLSDSARMRARVEARSQQQRKLQQAELPEGARWRRLGLADGVELHVSEDRLTPRTREQLHQLLHYAKGLFRQ